MIKSRDEAIRAAEEVFFQASGTETCRSSDRFSAGSNEGRGGKRDVNKASDRDRSDSSEPGVADR